MHPRFVQSVKRARIYLLTGRRSRVQRTGYQGGEIVEPFYGMTRWKQAVGEFDKVEPLEGRILELSAIRVEAIDVDSCSHDSHKKSKGHSEEWPLSRQHAVGGYFLDAATGPTLLQAEKFPGTGSPFTSQEGNNRQRLTGEEL